MNEKSNPVLKSGIYEKGKVNLGDIIESIKMTSSIGEAGSIVTVTGIVRSSSTEGEPV